MQSCQHRPRWFWLIWVNLESILGKLKVIFHCVFVFLPGCYGKGLTMCSPTSEAASRLRRHHIMILLLLLDYPAIFWLPVLIFGIAALILESTSPRCWFHIRLSQVWSPDLTPPGVCHGIALWSIFVILDSVRVLHMLFLIDQELDCKWIMMLMAVCSFDCLHFLPDQVHLLLEYLLLVFDFLMPWTTYLRCSLRRSSGGKATFAWVLKALGFLL